MTTSSAEPDRLEAYPDTLTVADDELSTLAGDLDEAMAAFAGGAGHYLGQGFDQAWAGELVRGLRDESCHLGGWVAGVGRAFREASAQGIPPEQLDTFIAQQVGEPTIVEAQQAADGEQDAEELSDALAAVGIDPEHFDREQLVEFVAAGGEGSEEILALMNRIGGRMSNGDYATGFYDQMNTDGIRTVMGVIDTLAFLEGPGIQHDLLEPFVQGWANASDSPDLAEERAGLLDTTNSVEQRHLALLMSGDPASYDPEWLADAADRILVSGVDLNEAQYPQYDPMSNQRLDYPGFSTVDFLYEDQTLGIPEMVAMRALDGNTEAAWSFASRGPAHVDALVHPTLPAWYSGEVFGASPEWQEAFEANAAGAVEEAFLKAPLETRPDPDDPTQQVPLVSPEDSARTYDDLIESVAEGDVPDVIKQSVARTLLPHLTEIGTAAADQSATSAIETDTLFQRGDLVAFFKELGHDTDAAGIVGEQLGIWGSARVDVLAQPAVAPTPGDVENALDPVGLITGAVYQGFNETENAMAEANNALAFGIRQGGALVGGLAPPVVGFIAAGPVGGVAGLGIAGGGQLVSQVSALGGNTLANLDVDLEVDGNDVQRGLVTALREQLVLDLQSQGVISPGIPPGEYSGALADYFGGNDPIDELNQDSFVSAFNADPDEPW
ncbi:MAG: hypothetical protein ACRD0U_03970 [Acidimicrobiales bacterium]